MKIIRIQLTFICLFFLGALLANCRGQISSKEPIHLNPNMDFQDKINPQRKALMPPKNIIPWGDSTDPLSPKRKHYLKENIPFYEGKTFSGTFVPRIPLVVNQVLLQKGQERYNIYCAACHDRAGTGKSQVVARGMVQPTDFADKRIVQMTDGEIFNIISYGIRNMPGYYKKISPQERWAIISYVRALQISRNAAIKDVPKKQLKSLQ